MDSHINFKKLFLILPIFVLLSCEKILEDLIHINRWVKYTIYSGEQYSTQQVAKFSGDELQFYARFDSSAVYTTSDPKNQSDINKLYGFSDCGGTHKENSARFGWCWNPKKNMLEIYAFCHINGQMQYKFVTNVDLHRDYLYKIKISGNKYIFNLEGNEVTMDRGCSDNVSIKYYLFPYFGGNESAPHNITLYIKEIIN